MNGHTWLRLLLAVGALFFGACASFDREWQSARRAPAAARKADPFGGAWDGTWSSAKHRLPSGKEAGGRLRCIFTRTDAAHYRAKFHAHWLIFAGTYEVTFETRRQGDVLTFRGEHDLGTIFGGVYRYTGSATPRRFTSDFASKWDHGRFEMARPGL